jgi:hypothetical protein
MQLLGIRSICVLRLYSKGANRTVINCGAGHFGRVVLIRPPPGGEPILSIAAVLADTRAARMASKRQQGEVNL